jgi:hypothetical protein
MTHQVDMLERHVRSMERRFKALELLSGRKYSGSPATRDQLRDQIMQVEGQVLIPVSEVDKRYTKGNRRYLGISMTS